MEDTFALTNKRIKLAKHSQFNMMKEKKKSSYILEGNNFTERMKKSVKFDW